MTVISLVNDTYSMARFCNLKVGCRTVFQHFHMLGYHLRNVNQLVHSTVFSSIIMVNSYYLYGVGYFFIHL